MTLELRCGDLGLACRTVVKADSKEELLAKVDDHARRKHNVQLTETLRDYAAAQARETGR